MLNFVPCIRNFNNSVKEPVTAAGKICKPLWAMYICTFKNGKQFPLCIATKTQSHEIPRKFSAELVFLCFRGRFYQRNALKAGIAVKRKATRKHFKYRGVIYNIKPNISNQ